MVVYVILGILSYIIISC